MNYNDKIKVAEEMMYGNKSIDEEMATLCPQRYMEDTKPFNNFWVGGNDTQRDKTTLRKRRYR